MALRPLLLARDNSSNESRLVDAVAELYRSCHLRAPGVIDATDPMHLARVVRALSPATAACLLLLASILSLSGALALTFTENARGLGAFLCVDPGIFFYNSRVGAVATLGRGRSGHRSSRVASGKLRSRVNGYRSMV
jgi:hypothetical protein